MIFVDITTDNDIDINKFVATNSIAEMNGANAPLNGYMIDMGQLKSYLSVIGFNLIQHKQNANFVMEEDRAALC